EGRVQPQATVGCPASPLIGAFSQCARCRSCPMCAAWSSACRIHRELLAQRPALGIAVSVSTTAAAVWTTTVSAAVSAAAGALRHALLDVLLDRRHAVLILLVAIHPEALALAGSLLIQVVAGGAAPRAGAGYGTKEDHHCEREHSIHIIPSLFESVPRA